MHIYLKNRFKLMSLIFGIFLLISFITRTVLLINSFSMLDLSLLMLVKIYAIGAFYDFVAVSYITLPLSLYLLVVSKKIWQKKIHHYIIYTLLYLILFSMVFYSFSEWFFWEEFGVRFNFIAVDYIVYTTEVIGNINESYPMEILIPIITAISAILFFFIYRSNFFRDIFQDERGFKKRFSQLLVYLLLPIVFFYSVTQEHAKISTNQYNNELAKAGLYSLFSAFINNKLDYNTFYITQDNQKVLTNLRKNLKLNNIKDEGILHRVENKKQDQNYNVIMIVVESLSAEFLESLNGFKGITPNLDKLTKNSLFFNNFYATGTRTVRGMESIVLSIPPTPGRSIVKRPDNHNMFSTGFIFKERGYDTKFIYGGHGYFDNMNEFFGNNGFEVVDRTNFSDEEDTYHTVWGVCDEDLLNKTLKESDKSFKAHKPFFSFIMTTSNHRPYNYPDGRIDIASHSGREGAVKYTDFAIAKFLKDAQKKEWFKDTIFVIVADHCASSAGKTNLPLNKYHIPLFIYAPHIVEPKVITKVASQIDIMPTIFSMLNWSYDSKFYGEDILANDFKERALISTYQLLGLYQDDILTILSPNKKIDSYKIVNKEVFFTVYEDIPTTKKREDKIVSYFQGADILHKKRLDRK